MRLKRSMASTRCFWAQVSLHTHTGSMQARVVRFRNGSGCYFQGKQNAGALPFPCIGAPLSNRLPIKTCRKPDTQVLLLFPRSSRCSRGNIFPVRYVTLLEDYFDALGSVR